MPSFVFPSRPRAETLVEIWDRQDGCVAGEGHSNLDIDSEEPDYNPEEDQEPETTNRLTFFEMRTVLRRASGNRISDRERAGGCDADASGRGEISLFFDISLSAFDNLRRAWNGY